VDTEPKNTSDRLADDANAPECKPRFSLRALFVAMTLAAGAMAFAANFPDIALLLALAGLFVSLHFVPSVVMQRAKRRWSGWAAAGAIFNIIFFVLLAVNSWQGVETPRAAAVTIVAVFFLFIAISIYTETRRR
jgi:hypothetical protein